MSEIENALEKLDIPKNSSVIVHGNSAIAISIKLPSKEEKLQKMAELIMNFFEDKNTLIVPAFTYSFPCNEIYDPITSPSKVGQFSEYFRNNTDMIRTRHPIFSCLIKGSKSDLFMNASIADCFGTNTIFDFLLRDKGYIVLLGCNLNQVTFAHYVEQYAQVYYRYFKEFVGYIADDFENEVVTQYYVRDLNLGLDTRLDLTDLWLKARSLGLVKFCYLDRFLCLSIRSDYFSELAMEMIHKNPHALIGENFKNSRKIQLF